MIRWLLNSIRELVAAVMPRDHQAAADSQSVKTQGRNNPRDLVDVQGPLTVRKRPASGASITEISSVDELAPYAVFLVARLEAGAGRKGLTSAFYREHNVRCSHRTTRTWVDTLAAECWDGCIAKRYSHVMIARFLE